MMEVLPKDMQSFCNIYVYQINTSYILNFYNVICQLYLSKVGIEKYRYCTQCWGTSESSRIEIYVFTTFAIQVDHRKIEPQKEGSSTSVGTII